jgi:hypothetical protein
MSPTPRQARTLPRKRASHLVAAGVPDLLRPGVIPGKPTPGVSRPQTRRLPKLLMSSFARPRYSRRVTPRAGPALSVLRCRSFPPRTRQPKHPVTAERAPTGDRRQSTRLTTNWRGTCVAVCAAAARRRCSRWQVTVMAVGERGVRPQPGRGQRRSPAGNPASAQAPVFADLSGRRRRRMRRAGIVMAAALISCLTVVAVGLLGGPRAPFVPWAPVTADRAATGGRGGPAAGSSHPAPAPTVRPAPSAFPDLPPSPRRRSSPAPVSSGTSPAVTNPAGKAPPGQNHTRPPRPSPSVHTHAA